MKNHTETAISTRSVWRRALILMACIFTAIAVAVTCALCFGGADRVSVDNVEPEISESATYTDKVGNLTTVNAIAKGDILNYTSVGLKTVTLPTGTYTIEVWGAQGGVSSHASTANNTGGYAKATLALKTNMTIYIAVGGKGTDGNSGYAGGWNGGGGGGKASSDTGGGGGASHIAVSLIGDGQLKNYASSRANVVIVAGGGGGNGCSNYIGGKGGGASGTAGTYSSQTYGATGAGGTATAGGATRSGYSAAASFGQGGSGASGYYGCGGGGGGWFGGSAGTNQSGGGASGGGGSGYVNTGGTNYTVSGGSMTVGGRTGNGMARITVVQVNQGPVSKSYTGSLNYRGTGKSISVAASTIAQDSDYANTSGAAATSVYYTAGNTSNYDTLPAANNGLYLDSGCTKLANTYLSWTWTNTSTLNINAVHRYPRSGVDNCTANGRLTLYTKVRDIYGTNTTRGVSVISFNMNVSDYGIGLTSARNYSGTGGAQYRYGTPTVTGLSNKTVNFMSNSSAIYNPVSGSTTRTLFIPKPLAPTDTAGYTVSASDLFSDADTAYDKVGIKSVTEVVPSGGKSGSAYYNISYNADSSYASGLVPSFTIKPSGVRPTEPTYVVATITANTSETASKAIIGSANTSVQVVFRIANTRPYFASSSSVATKIATEPYIEIAQGATKQLKLSEIVYDVDDATLTSYFAQGTTDLKVPTNEYIQVDMMNIPVPLNTSYGGRSSNYAGKTEVASDSATTGMGSTPTGFTGKEGVIARVGSASAATASVTYTYVNSTTISFTARAATQYMYSDVNSAAHTRLGDFYVLVRIIDPSDTSDNGLWYPIAIRVTSQKPTEPSTVANVSLDWGDGYVAGDGSKDAAVTKYPSVLLTPISYTNSAGVLTGIGTSDLGATSETAVHAQPFVVDPDTFMYSASGYEKTRPLNDIVMLDGTSVDTVCTLYETSSFFTVEIVPLYAAKSVFSRLGMSASQLATFGVSEVGGQSNLYVFNGLKITGRRSTSDYYFQFDVKVKDSHDSKSTVRVAVNVRNRDVVARRAATVDPTTGVPTESITTGYKINPITGYGKYIYNTNIGVNAVNYTIERNDVLQITPYDFAYDLDNDSDKRINNETLNSNPVDTTFDATARNVILKSYSIPHTTSLASPATAATPVTGQQLGFINVGNLVSNAAQYSSYITLSVEDTVVRGMQTYAIPCIKITGVSRTTSAVVQLRFTISDGYSSIPVTITVTVRNSAPMLNTIENHPKESDRDTRIAAPYSLTATEGSTNPLHELSFTASGIAYDKDGDTPTFVPGSARIVAYVGSAPEHVNDPAYYVTALDQFNNAYVEGDGVTLKYKLSDYVYTAITKNSGGDDVVLIRGLSSTQTITRPIYLAVDVQDGFRAQPEISTLYVLIEVVNSKPLVVTDSLIDIGGNATWLISYESAAEKKLTRYIANSRELCESSALAVSASNKVWLFDDADSQQNVMLNPQALISTGTNGMATSNDIAKLVYKTDKTEREDMRALFLDENSPAYNAAVVYSRTYNSSTSGDLYLNVSIVFFKKTVLADGTVKFEETMQNIAQCEYWAIRITDPQGGATGEPTRIAIAIKDNHHNADKWNAAKNAKVEEDSNYTWLDFRYDYQTPGITAMHDYYRTDGNVEANTFVNGVDASDGYVVDINGVQFDADYQFAAGTAVPHTQDALKTASFSDKFKYQYFVKTITKQNNAAISVPTYKHYPSKGMDFYYEPVEVEDMNPAKVPMSYIAMPLTGTEETEGSSYSHVTLANATSGSTLTGSYKLIDSHYDLWGKNENDVFANMTLTDVNGQSWSGAALNNNPYITIKHITCFDKNSAGNYIYGGDAGGGKYIDSKYLNTNRYVLTRTSDGAASAEFDPVDWQYDGSNGTVAGMSKFREDKYGFLLSKKDGGRRSTGTLRLTIAVKTTSSSSSDSKESQVENVGVDIVLKNSKPTASYNNEDISGYTDKIAINMTTSNTTGKSLALVTGDDIKTGDYRIKYTDRDTTDTMKFLMSSAVGGLSEADFKYVDSSTNITGSSRAVTEYFGGAKPAAYDATFVPNPGYEKFFKVSPMTGAATSIQFVPVAKTQLNIPKDATDAEIREILDENHLKMDSDTKKIYYPFKILFYDDVNNSPFTSGSWCEATIRVYIDNDPISVNKKIVEETYNRPNTVYNGKPVYRFKLSKGTEFRLDVSTLLNDNDISLNETSNTLLVKEDAQWKALPDSQKLVSDYLVMPDTFTTVSGDFTKFPVSVERPGLAKGSPETTLVFNATSAFMGNVDIMYEFSDSVKEVTGKETVKCQIIFSISYNNETPTANEETFGGSETRNIVLSYGQSFKLYASDYNLFKDDVNGGFTQTSELIAGIGSGTIDYPKQTAAELNTAFGTGEKYLGALILGSDDAASTLRILSATLPYGDEQLVTVKKLLDTRTANNSDTLPMGLEVTAQGVVNTTLTIELIDSGEAITVVKFNITVTSSAPEVRPADTSKLTYVSGNTFSTNMVYGEEKAIMLKSFMHDVDLDDDSGLVVYRNADNSYYSVTNPEGVSAVSAENGLDGTDNTIVIKANDFIPNKDGMARITFRVSDKHGATSETVTIQVNIAPRDVSAVAVAAKPYALAVKSYADYLREGTPVTLDIVSLASTATVFADPDVNAPSAAYDVEVYAMLRVNSETGSVEQVTDKASIGEDSLLYRRTRTGITPGVSGMNTVLSYVRKFFDISVSTDGKYIEFIPNSATISRESTSTALSQIRLYIKIGKRYNEGTRQTTSSNAEGFVNVSVANSGIVAVENTPFNSGYPRVPVANSEVEGEMRLRDQAFLEFSGTAGDSLTWDLYNLDNFELGLFRDYDMENTRVGESGSYTVDGEEKMYYVAGRYEGVTEAISIRTPILSVSSTADGRGVTIKINRKVYTGQPPTEGIDATSTKLTVKIYATDTIGHRAGTTNFANCAVATITVNVENDIPEIKCIDDFAPGEKTPDYTVTYSDVEGFVLDERLERGEKLTVKIADIIKDADKDMDVYVLLSTGSSTTLVGEDGYLVGSSTTNGTNDGIGRLRKGSETLFTVRLHTAHNEYGISTLSDIEFTCESALRGEVATCQLMFRDTVKTATTRILTVNLTVDNIAPTAKAGASMSVTVMGVDFGANDETQADAVRKFSVLDFIDDANGDAYDPDEASADKLPTYTFIDEITVYTTLDGDASFRPTIYGPGKDGDGSEQSAPAIYVCNVDWASDDERHQTFSIIPVPGVYGVQRVGFKVTDSGYADGSQEGVLDGKTYDLVITIIIANPLSDVADILPAKRIAYGVTATVTIQELLGEQNAQGYTIDKMVEADGGNNLRIYAPGEEQSVRASATGEPSTENWRIAAITPDVKPNVIVTFRAGSITRDRTLPVHVIANTAPDYRAGRTTYEYTTNKLDDKNSRTLKIYPEDWFDDIDPEDIMQIVGPVVSSQSVKVDAMIDYDDISEGGRAYILLTFNRRGESDITFNVIDLSGKLYSRTITVNCTDAPELSWWENIVSFIEANWLWFWVILGAVLLFIILLIIIIVVVAKKRKMRREIEALLESETELEEEMMRLNASAMPYQSFGFLPPTRQTMGDPGLMLGGGAAAPQPNNLQLNAGTGVPPTQTAQVNSVPGSRPQGVPPTQARPQGAPTQTPPTRPANDGFNPDEF